MSKQPIIEPEKPDLYSGKDFLTAPLNPNALSRIYTNAVRSEIEDRYAEARHPRQAPKVRLVRMDKNIVDTT